MPLIFVYIGHRLPSYVVSSLKMAVAYSNQEVVIILNRSAASSVGDIKCRVVFIESFYDNSSFLRAQDKLSSSKTFRNSLWSRSLERFFILQQYMQNHKLQEVFHAELDQFLFDTNTLACNLRKVPDKGFFSTSHSASAAIASVVYCNSIDILNDFLSFVLIQDSFYNEMELLAKWANKGGKFVELVNLDAYIHGRKTPLISNSKVLELSFTSGIVDSAEFGQWFGGIDPRNVPILKLPTNKFVGPRENRNLDETELSNCVLSFESESNRLFVEYENLGKVQVFNLHIHSKIHSDRFLNRNYFNEVVDLVNSREIITFPGTRKVQIQDYFLSYARAFLRKLAGFNFFQRKNVS